MRYRHNTTTESVSVSEYILLYLGNLVVESSIMRSNPLDLSILLRGGKEINEDSRSTGEGKEMSQS